MRSLTRSPSVICLALAAYAFAGPAPATAQTNTATVSTTSVEDSFFNPCTSEVVDRSYTQHVTRRKVGDDYVLRVNWSNGKGVGRTSGDKYTMGWKYQQMNESGGGQAGAQQTFTYRIKTTVHAEGSASDYNSDIVVRLRTNADGSVKVDQSEATGITCS